MAGKSKEDYKLDIALLLEEFRLLVKDKASEAAKKAKGEELLEQVDGLIRHTDAVRDNDYLDYIEESLTMFDGRNRAILAARWAVQADAFLTVDAKDDAAMVSKMAAFRMLVTPECMLYRDNVPEIKTMFEAERLGEELLQFQMEAIFQTMKDDTGRVRRGFSREFGLN